MKLSELAERIACRLHGDGEIDIVRVAGIEEAQPGDVTFLANRKYEKLLPATRASAVILREDAPPGPCASLHTSDPYLAFARAVALFAPVWRPAPGVHPLTAIAAEARLGRDVSIAAFVSIGERAVVGDRTVIFPNVTIGADARIGDDCVVHSNVSIRDGVVVGSRVVLQNGVVLGSDGYGFVRRGDGTHEKIPQFAPVVIEDDVEIGANSAVDRPAVGETRVGRGTKIDNLVQVAHGVTVGRNVLMAAQVGIAGSSAIGDDVVFAGQVGVAGHVSIGRGVVALAQTGIPNSIEPGAMVAGYPAMDSRDWRRAAAVYRRLPELKRRVEELERRVAELAARDGGGSRGQHS